VAASRQPILERHYLTSARAPLILELSLRNHESGSANSTGLQVIVYVGRARVLAPLAPAQRLARRMREQCRL